MPRQRCFVLLVSLALTHRALPCLAGAPPPSLEEAATLARDGKVEAAAAAYQAITAADPANGLAWFELGQLRMRLDQLEAAEKAYGEADRLGARPFISRYNRACALARLGRSEAALDALERALPTGNLRSEAMRSDPDLASLRESPRFAAIAARADEKARPCEHDPRRRRFDFWIGDWDVFSGSQKAGENRIERSLDGCLLIENWTSAIGGSGKSLNFLDGAAGRWRQVWVDSGGEAHLYIEREGVVKDGEMLFEGEGRPAEGAAVARRLSFTRNPDGSVRQVGEVSSDGGKTFSVEYDFRYVKKR